MGRRTRQRLAELENPTEGSRNQWQVQKWQEIQNAVASRGIDVSKRKGRRQARKFIASNPDIGWFKANQYVKLLKEKEKQQRALNEVQSVGSQLNGTTNINPPSYNQQATNIPPDLSNWKLPENNKTNKSLTGKQEYIRALNAHTSKQAPTQNQNVEYNSNFSPQKDTKRDYDFLDQVDLMVLNPYLLSGIGILRRTNPGMRDQLTNWDIKIAKGQRLDRATILQLLGAHNVNPINKIYKAWVKDNLQKRRAEQRIEEEDYEQNMEAINGR